MNVLERGASDLNVMATEKLLSTDETDNDHLEISTTEPENIIHETVDLGEVMESESSKELKLADAISCNPATMLSTAEESLQSDKMLTVDPISIYDSMSDVHLLSTSKNTENNVTLNEEKPTFENSEVTQDQHFEDGEWKWMERCLRK
ncbi:neurofilament heavy polypeptide-like [Iris pallida]|uniref:Neurofilament heavy polypeptide-like n=1 Tax=Iris pallida TaxID=29817 RepID=A0AAX6E6C6_IRIPA|nr:neurofilament heavy polypeptide-like [Iris pallida]